MNKKRQIAWLGAAVLAALTGMAQAAHDPGKAPLAADAKIVENVKRIQPGEGLWKTTTAGPTEFSIVIPDPVSQQVGGIVVMQSEGNPVQLGFRLKLASGKIVEAEHLVVPIRDANNPLLQQVRPAIPMEVPYEDAGSRG